MNIIAKFFFKLTSSCWLTCSVCWDLTAPSMSFCTLDSVLSRSSCTPSNSSESVANWVNLVRELSLSDSNLSVLVSSLQIVGICCESKWDGSGLSELARHGIIEAAYWHYSEYWMHTISPGNYANSNDWKDQVLCNWYTVNYRIRVWDVFLLNPSFLF